MRSTSSSEISSSPIVEPGHSVRFVGGRSGTVAQNGKGSDIVGVDQSLGLVGLKDGRLARRCESFGPRTAWAGFKGTIWPTTIQSKSILRAARRTFVKNAELGFAIPYLHNVQTHDYVPDFLVRLKDVAKRP